MGGKGSGRPHKYLKVPPGPNYDSMLERNTAINRDEYYSEPVNDYYFEEGLKEGRKQKMTQTIPFGPVWQSTRNRSVLLLRLAQMATLVIAPNQNGAYKPKDRSKKTPTMVAFIVLNTSKGQRQTIPFGPVWQSTRRNDTWLLSYGAMSTMVITRNEKGSWKASKKDGRKAPYVAFLSVKKSGNVIRGAFAA